MQNNSNAETISEMKNESKLIVTQLKTAKDYQTKSNNYIKKMIKFAQKDYEKKYANLLLLQSNAYLKIINNKIVLYNSFANLNLENDTEIDNVMKLFDTIPEKNSEIFNQSYDYVNQREEIRALYPSFTERLDKEYNLSEKATL